MMKTTQMVPAVRDTAQKRHNVRPRAACLRTIAMPLLALAILAALVCFAQPATARMLPEDARSSPEALTTYIVVFDEMAPAETQAAYANMAGLVEASGGRVAYEFSLIKGMIVEIPNAALGKLTGFPGVKYVDRDQPARLSMDEVVKQVQISNVWNNPAYAGIDGTGVTICVIDGGVDYRHPDLQGQVIWMKDFMVATGSGDGSAPDDNGHGTFVAGQIAGLGTMSMTAEGAPYILQRTINGFEDTSPNDPVNYTKLRGPFKGIATGAKLVCLKVSGATGDTTHSMVLRAVDYATTRMYDNNGQRIVPDIISMSINSGIHNQSMDDMMDAAVQSKITVIVSAGNTGPNPQTVQCPGDDPSVITVGSANRNDTVSDFSSRGPGVKGAVKPDILAVGESVLSIKPVWWNQINEGSEHNYVKYYTVMSGTSMATPEVSATAALIIQYYKQQHNGVKPTPEQVKAILLCTARQPPGCPPIGDMNWGAGVLNASAALYYVSTGSIPSLPPKPLATASMDKQSYLVDESQDELRAGVTVVWSSEARAGDVATISYEALSGSGGSGSGAVPGVNYALAPGVLTFTKGSAQLETQYIKVDILDDGIPGSNKYFNLRLTSDRVATPTLSTVTIKDSDYAIVKFAVNSYTVKNGAGEFGVDVLVDRSRNPGAGAIRVNFSTENGSALAGQDYVAKYVTLEFGTTDTNKTVKVNVLNNLSARGVSYFTLRLNNSTNARLGSPSADTVWITAAGASDRTPPVLSPPVFDPGSPIFGEWYKGDVTVKLQALDSESGPRYIAYEVNDGPTTKVYDDSVDVRVTEDGESDVVYRAADNAGNAASGEATVKIDRTPPYFRLENRTPGIIDDQWVNVPITAWFKALDDNSGVRGNPFLLRTVTGEGYNQPVSLSATDNVGNVITTTAYHHFNIDMTPPSSTCKIVPDTGTNAFTNTPPVQVTLNATDRFASGADGSGVKHINYSLDGGTTWTTLDTTPVREPGETLTTYTTTPFDISANGVTTVLYYAEDNAGNVEVGTDPGYEPYNHARIGIDINPPSVVSSDITVTGVKNPDGSYNGEVKVKIRATEPETESGFAKGMDVIFEDIFEESYGPEFSGVPINHTFTDRAGNSVKIEVGTFTIYAISLTVGPIFAPSDPISFGTVDTNIQVGAPYSSGPGLTRNTWSWGDGTADTAGTDDPIAHTVNNTHKYNKTGIFSIMVTVVDATGQKSARYDYIVIYDPNGRMSGLGTARSPSIQYAGEIRTSGNEIFATYSEYIRGTLVPCSYCGFNYNSGRYPYDDLLFLSTSSDWMVVSGNSAFYYGSGMILEKRPGKSWKYESGYRFLFAGFDGSTLRPKVADKLHMKIWYPDVNDQYSGPVKYDNMPNTAINATPTNTIRLGDILVRG